MKKILCLILALAMSIFVFSGCGGTPDPNKVDRWQDGETGTYTIRLVDKDLDGSDFYEYPAVQGAPVVPLAVEDGSQMTFKISTDEKSNWVFDVKVTILQTFDASDFADDSWKEGLDEGEDKDYTLSNGKVTFTTTMTSQAVFDTIADGGKPISSTKAVKGVTVLRAQNTKQIKAYRNDFETSVQYENGVAKATFTDNTGTVDKPKNVEVNVGTGLLFDNEAMMLAVRSINFSVLERNNTVTLNFFNAVEQKTQTVSVVFDTQTFQFEDDENAPNYIRVAANPSSMGYPYYFYFEQHDKMPNYGSSGGSGILRYYMVRMCQGYLCFEKV